MLVKQKDNVWAVALVETLNKKDMKREIIVKVVIDWNDYEDTCDELILEDSGIYENLKDGVSIELNKHKVSNNEVSVCDCIHIKKCFFIVTDGKCNKGCDIFKQTVL